MRFNRFSRFIARGLATCLVALALTFFLPDGVRAGPIESVPPKRPDTSPTGKVLFASENVMPAEAFRVEEIHPSRIFPQAYYDQSVSSIRAIHPDGEIVDGERLGDGFHSHYAFVAYKEAKGAKSVRLDCAATDYRKAYHLTTQVEEKDLESTVSALLMKLSSLFSPVDGSPRPAVWFRDNCLPLRDSYADSHDKKVECRVNGYGALAQVGNTRYFFSLYRWLVRLGDDDAGAGGIYDTLPYNSTAVVILSSSAGGGAAYPLFSFRNEGMIGVSWFEEPKVVENGYGKILVIPERISGTGAGTNDRYLVWRRGRWRKIDSASWQKDLQVRLPKGHGIWKGIPVDIEAMKFEAPLWRNGDANCCPSGGRVKIDLILREERLEIGTFRRVPPDG